MTMIARCLHAGAAPLTAGKLYPVVGYRDDWLVIRDDAGVESLYPTVRFRIEHTVPAPVAEPLRESVSAIATLSILRRGVSLS